jgi:hypothetical protein
MPYRAKQRTGKAPFIENDPSYFSKLLMGDSREWEQPPQGYVGAKTEKTFWDKVMDVLNQGDYDKDYWKATPFKPTQSQKSQEGVMKAASTAQAGGSAMGMGGLGGIISGLIAGIGAATQDEGTWKKMTQALPEKEEYSYDEMYPESPEEYAKRVSEGPALPREAAGPLQPKAWLEQPEQMQWGGGRQSAALANRFGKHSRDYNY